MVVSYIINETYFDFFVLTEVVASFRQLEMNQGNNRGNVLINSTL